MWDKSKHPRDAKGRFCFAYSSWRTRSEMEEIRRLEQKYTSQSLLPSTIPLPDEQLPRSVGAKWINYEVRDLYSGEMYRFVEGSRLQNVEVFCGYGTNHIYRDAYKYAVKVGGLPEEWQHVKAIGILDTPEGYRKAEIHWSQHRIYGRHDMFIKRWID